MHQMLPPKAGVVGPVGQPYPVNPLVKAVKLKGNPGLGKG